MRCIKSKHFYFFFFESANIIKASTLTRSKGEQKIAYKQETKQKTKTSNHTQNKWERPQAQKTTTPLEAKTYRRRQSPGS
jgi:hypothetical protein